MRCCRVSPYEMPFPEYRAQPYSVEERITDEAIIFCHSQQMYATERQPISLNVHTYLAPRVGDIEKGSRKAASHVGGLQGPCLDRKSGRLVDSTACFSGPGQCMLTWRSLRRRQGCH